MTTETDFRRILDTFSKFLDKDLLNKLLFSKKGKVKKLDSIEAILNLPIYSFKFLDKNEAKILEDLLDVFDIRTASKLNKDDPFESLLNLESTEDPIKAAQMREDLGKQIDILKEKFPHLVDKIKKAVTISSLIVDVKAESFELSKEQQKVVVAGLDDAGKTALISKFGGRLGITDLASLTPTKGVDRRLIETKNIDLIILDMGGQEQYRERYKEKPELYFLQLDLLIYVIDIQDSERFDETLEYLGDVLKIIVMLEENPYILIFFHKFDPDIKHKPEVLLNQELLNTSLKEIFNKYKNEDKRFDYEIYLTSIYSLISNEPQFAKFIKDVMKTGYSLTDPTVRKIDGLGNILEETMNAIIKLSESIAIQIENLDNRLRAIESGEVSLNLATRAEDAKVQAVEARETSKRSQVFSELKDLFAKKRGLDL